MFCPADKTHLEVFATELKGLYVDLLCSGRKTFRVRCWHHSKKKSETIGNVLEMSVNKAREYSLQRIAICQ